MFNSKKNRFYDYNKFKEFRLSNIYLKYMPFCQDAQYLTKLISEISDFKFTL